MTHDISRTYPPRDATEPIHESLNEKDLLPATHIVDTGYLDAKLLMDSRQDYGIDLFGPTRPDYKRSAAQWQAQAKEGFAAEHFNYDWQKREATCPEGKMSTSWSPYTTPSGLETVKNKFAQKDCVVCRSWSKCTRCGTLLPGGEPSLYAKKSIT
jgi:transposase